MAGPLPIAATARCAAEENRTAIRLPQGDIKKERVNLKNIFMLHSIIILFSIMLHNRLFEFIFLQLYY